MYFFRVKDILKTVEDVKMIVCGHERPISIKEAVYDAFGASGKADLAGYIILTDTILDRIMQHHIIPGDRASEDEETQKKNLDEV